MIEVSPVWTYLVLFFISSMSIAIYFMVRSSARNPVEEIEKDADTFAGVIKDGHGPITSFLWLTYVVLAVWLVAYLWQHIAEFFTPYY